MEQGEWLDGNNQATVTFVSNGSVGDYDYLISLLESHLRLTQRCFDVRADALPTVYEKLDTALFSLLNGWSFPSHALAEHDRDCILPPRLATAMSRVLGHATVHTFYLRRCAFSTFEAFS